MAQVIPAENLVAAFQSGPGALLGVAPTAADARVMLEALEAGTAGVVLRTEDPLEVRGLLPAVAHMLPWWWWWWWWCVWGGGGGGGGGGPPGGGGGAPV
jgi:hypothetical protein